MRRPPPVIHEKRRYILRYFGLFALAAMGAVSGGLAVGAQGCIAAWPTPYIHNVYQCWGECEVCVATDSSGACTSWSPEPAQLTDAGTGAPYPKVVCAVDLSEAATMCLADIEANVRDGYAVADVRNCTITSGPAETDAECTGDDDEEKDAGASEDEYVPQRPWVDDVALNRTWLKLTTGSSLQVTYRGSTSTSTLTGRAQVEEDPFVLHSLHLVGTDVTVGGEAYNKPYLRNDSPILGELGNNGDYTLASARHLFPGSYVRNSMGEARYVATLGNVTGNLNFTNMTFSGTMDLRHGADRLLLTLSGAVVNRPPIANFTAGTVSNCQVPVDGTSSSDPDGGSIVGYYWRVNGRPKGTGSTANLPVKQGLNTIQLIVSDNEDSTPVRAKAVQLTVNASPPC